MEMWTDDQDGAWKRWSHAALGLYAVASARPPIVRVLLIGRGSDEGEQLLAAIRLTRRLAAGPVTVMAGSEHPSASWRDSVRQAGADRALFVRGPEERRWQENAPLDEAVELGDGVCSELHAQHERQSTLSVCGRHNDRMVLAPHHFIRWCLATREECPHWRGGPRE